jgi:hypothetical protein
MPAVPILDRRSRRVILCAVKALAVSMMNVFLSCSLKLIFASTFLSVTDWHGEITAADKTQVSAGIVYQ